VTQQRKESKVTNHEKRAVVIKRVVECAFATGNEAMLMDAIVEALKMPKKEIEMVARAIAENFDLVEVLASEGKKDATK
jgi:translation elongation factor P/translation initiation factor 5A